MTAAVMTLAGLLAGARELAAEARALSEAAEVARKRTREAMRAVVEGLGAGGCPEWCAGDCAWLPTHSNILERQHEGIVDGWHLEQWEFLDLDGSRRFGPGPDRLRKVRS
ncbi:hypothetical protein [Demequina capsici]|uniref:Uncharacterized protein n=1 Tax=Demequina capsici TaxID=3075620 RepID=A0AA96F8M7_9MICO|nr:hypothetical protein [Demequina sp. OYTSA14]WNM25279.1 hypothetical protein RN606_03790 [Demequina sp. OYTSA14]